jgi:hypothetical protein
VITRTLWAIIRSLGAITSVLRAVTEIPEEGKEMPKRPGGTETKLPEAGIPRRLGSVASGKAASAPL